MVFFQMVSDKKIASKAAWAIYMFASAMMGAMTYFSMWPVWLAVQLLINMAVCTFFTFYPKTTVKLQSFFVMLGFFANVFLCSVAAKELYFSLIVFLGAAIVLAAYLSEKLLLGYSLLIAWGILYHFFVLKTVDFSSSLYIVQFIVRVGLTFTALIFLVILIKAMNLNKEMMRKSVEEARRAEQYKSDFLANMSHEIRTPMNAIIGMCELILRENSLSEVVTENCFSIQTSGKNLLAIINDILDFSKIESGNMELINEEFNIASVLNDVINISEARKGMKDLEILVNVDPNIPRRLIGDQIRIMQVIINLMTNAIKFTEKGSITLTVSHTVQDYGINLFVSVADTGIGITEENIEKLFTTFRQIDTKKNRSVEGTGLGLAISKRLIGQMGGFISVKSEYGVGSDFRFTIPLSVADDRPFAVVKEPDKIHAVICFGEGESGERQEHVFNEMGRLLGIDFECVKNLTELKELAIAKALTHIFITGQEYLRDSGFFTADKQKAQVFIIQDRGDNAVQSDGIKRIYKPFYVIPAVSTFNSESIVMNLNERRGADIRFTAPQAKILIVDDNAVNLKVAVGLMQPYNMQIITTQSGPGSIEILRSKDIDIVFMDHMMPVMDGVEATGIIRGMEGEYYQKLPIIALTANTVNGAREMFLDSGFSDFLAKPIELSALDRILRNFLPQEYIQAPTTTYHGKWGRRKSDRREPDSKEFGRRESDRRESGRRESDVREPGRRESDRRESDRRESEDSSLLNVEKGISYIGGNEEVYRDILSLYVRENAEKIQQIEKMYKEKDLKNYVIEVHALKSGSLNIGAVRLSELAKELEAAGKAGNLDGYEKKNDELLKLYREVEEAARKYLGDIDEPVSQEKEENIELSAISADAVREYIAKAIAACRNFDGDTVSSIAAEASAYSFEGEPLRNYFGKAAQLVEDFEYEAAENELARLEAGLGGEKAEAAAPVPE